jgi:hypothetical protein
MYSTAGSGPGHLLYDPGPLLFWLLAIPVRIDPAHGSLWGATILAGAVLSLAIEAVWSTRQWLGCAVVAFVAVDILWLEPTIFEDLMWNAHFPIPFMISAIALALVIASGRLGWWPPLVLIGSVAAQSHLIYLIPMVALVLAAPVIGVVLQGRPKRLRWLLLGLIVGCVCWLAPIVQNFGANGNLSALVRSSRGQATMGFSFGLRVLGTAGSPSPLWLRHEPGNFYSVHALIDANAPVLGILVLCFLVAIAFVAYFLGHRSLCAYSLVSLTCSVGVLVSFAAISQKNVFNVDYVISLLWVVSTMVWTVVVWSLAAIVVALLRLHNGAAFDRNKGALAAVIGLLITGAVAIVGLGGGGASLSTLTTNGANGEPRLQYKSVGQIAERIEHATPRGPVAISSVTENADEFAGLDVSEGVAWRLEADGWQPGLYDLERAFSGLIPSPRSSAFVITIGPEGVPSVMRVLPATAQG